MPNINIRIQDKIASLLSTGVTSAVCNNSDYTVNFTFDSEWTSLTDRVARFSYDSGYTDVPFDDTSCSMPSIPGTKILAIGVFAGNIHTSTPAILPMQYSVLSGNGTPVADTSGVYEKVLTTLAGKQDIISDLATIRSGAAAGATALQVNGAASGKVPIADGSGGYAWGNIQPTVTNETLSF